MKLHIRILKMLLQIALLFFVGITVFGLLHRWSNLGIKSISELDLKYLGSFTFVVELI